MKRQPLALWAALLLGIAGFRARAEDGRGVALEDRLQALKVTAAALSTDDADDARWQKLERASAALAREFPNDARVREAHGEVLWSRGDRVRAMAQWEAAAHLEPANAAVLDRLANGWMALGEMKKAAACAAQATAREPANAAFHFTLANVSFLFRHELTDAARPDSEAVLRDALAHFAEASRLAPQNAEYLRAYAETFYSVAKPDWEAALAAWHRFLEITPRKDFAKIQLARVHLKLGRKEAAAECLDQIQTADFEKVKRRLREQIGKREPSSLPPG